ncbi:PD-(D/E)XK motif protein [Lichenicoccus roseus]|uniref:PD-(D/E)XK motif protein n=1 Tax=Lichenicoccus roseus TaxID=2683649 RepID=A0A5R9J126_9PROT|nr:PD-(D/E)XK motif protein [Lichenicoccus roseus]TLU71232.1 PD-(D/E)XK motif protein [Lichenicoccus roseus]
MADCPTPQQWAELRANRPSAEDAMAIMPITMDGTTTPLSIAMDQPGQMHLLIPVQRGPVGMKPPDLNGLKVRHRRMEFGDVLDLSAPSSHEPVFTPFCRDVVDAIIGQDREPWAAVATMIRAWQSAWKPVRQEMEKSVQVGVFGELLVLNMLMLPSLGPTAIYQWGGPDSERHDFVGDRLHLEVKTTRKSRAEHEISRLDQLRVSNGCQLLFVSVQVEQSVGGEHTVATQLDAVVQALRRDPAALDLFMLKMVNLGWTDEMRDSGELLRFNFRDAGIYEVDEHFPRIADDFLPPSGVVAVKYTVELANLPTLDVQETIAMIRKAGGA